jgi:subtilase family serine protease
MRINRVIFCSVLALAAIALIFSTWTSAQTGSSLRRITQAVDETKVVRLQGNTHPLARLQFDQGPAPADLPMERMMLVLKRSPEQEAALQKLMAEQLDKSSPNYHRWLTPEQFGQRFGPGDSDMQTITSWLESHGFQIESVAKGRNVIEFSGNAGQVNQALHTEIHKYVVKGEEHWANAGDPQIPAALTPVVAGVNTLHNFPRKPMSRKLGQYSRSKATGEVRPVNPNFTFDVGKACGLNNTCFAVGPADFAAIYHVQQLWTAGFDGTGQTIAIVNDSNINIADAHNFRSLFGLPVNDPHVILATGVDPGINNNGDEIEADIDTQWAGAVAKGATIDLVIAPNTVTAGVDTAAQFVVNTMNPRPPILSESFGNCESSLGTTTNQFFNNLWSQAATEGITVIVSTGDNGSAGCENPDPNSTLPQPASTGLAVSGIASTPFNTAIGGTDFNQLNNQSTFWNTTPTTGPTGQTQLTAKGYIPENVWNDSCTNTVFITAGFDPTILTACNDKHVTPSFIVPVGASGGMSSIYSKPSWQTALTPTDGKRDLPDVSLFAGAGLVGTFYVVCQQDTDTNNAACDLNSPFQNFSAVGGTSVSTQAFAGIMAIVLQENSPNAGLGLINPTLYTLAAGQTPANCNTSGPPMASCIFNDVTVGTNSMPCLLSTASTTSCGQAITSQVIRPPTTNTFRIAAGVLALACIFSLGFLLLIFRNERRSWSVVFALFAFALLLTCAACGSGGGGTKTGGSPTIGFLPGFNAGVGYDRATGLGTVNAANLVNNW